MRVTVCEMHNTLSGFEKDWEALVRHVRSESSDLLLLPEMPFYPWLAQSRQVRPELWAKSLAAHDKWIPRMSALGSVMVISSRPVIRHGKRFNEGFVREASGEYQPAHSKYYLPDDEGFWEASWYERGDRDFSVLRTDLGKIGFLICTELWFSQHARQYARQGAHLLVCPRATQTASTDKWIAGGRTAAVVSGAFCLSSNFISDDDHETDFGGTGWIIEPENGTVLGLTSREEPFLTLAIDLKAAEQAKQTYPRDVAD